MMPRIVMSSDPARCAPISATAHPYCCLESRPTASAEKVENVVSPPRKPVMMKRRHSGEIRVCWTMSSTATPIRYPPMMFDASVPSGRFGVNWLRAAESPHRSHAPSAAPTPTARKPAPFRIVRLNHRHREECGDVAAIGSHLGQGTNRGKPRFPSETSLPARSQRGFSSHRSSQ